MMAGIKEKIQSIPLTSGVYLMKDASNKVIYVGKAVCLRKRVQSYFRSKATMTKTDMLVAEIYDINYIETVSEAEALILEASLIKTYKPKYNIELRDDKSFPYIEISGEEFPRISVERPQRKKDDSVYYGPYVNPRLIREALSIIRKIFNFRTCHPFPDKECLDYHIGLCGAPCIGGVDKNEYARNIRNVVLILEGKKDELYRGLQHEMGHLVRRREFEAAAKVRDQLKAIGALYSGTKDVNYYKEAEQLKRAINLSRVPERVEAFDISNMMGDQAVGSMVTFLNGRPDKQNYRRFKIKEVDGIDDFSMIAEIVRRRYRRLRDEGRLFPDLILIDGGKGQLSAACQQLEVLKVDIPIISLAKREEEIYLPGKRGPVKLRKDSIGLQLLQRIRDEAHRFAVTYHRKLRNKNIFNQERDIV